MPREYRLSYPCDLFVTVEADGLDEAKKKLAECLEPLSDGIVVCLDHPKEWKCDPEERLYPRVDGDGPSASLVELEDCYDEDDEDDDPEDTPLHVPDAADPKAGGGEARTGA